MREVPPLKLTPLPLAILPRIKEANVLYAAVRIVGRGEIMINAICYRKGRSELPEWLKDMFPVGCPDKCNGYGQIEGHELPCEHYVPTIEFTDRVRTTDFSRERKMI